MTDTLFVGILLLGVGIWLVWRSFQFYLCRLQSKAHIYLIEGSHPAYQASSYGVGSLGIGAICVGVSMVLPLSSDTSDFIFYSSAAFFVIGFGLIVWQPRWLTPAWLRWIGEHNYDIRSVLGKEARQTPSWTERIRSQADLETWVAEIRQKHYRPQPIDTYTEALRRAGVTRPAKLPWGIGILVVALASGLGQLFLGNALIGFIIGGAVSLALYLLWSKKKGE